MKPNSDHGIIWPYLPLVYLFAFVLGVWLFDQVFPVRAINEVLEREHPGNLRWCLGLTFNVENGRSEEARVYLLIPDSINQAGLFVGGVATGHPAAVEFSIISTVMALGGYGLLAFYVSMEVRHRLRSVGEAEGGMDDRTSTEYRDPER